VVGAGLDLGGADERGFGGDAFAGRRRVGGEEDAQQEAQDERGQGSGHGWMVTRTGAGRLSSHCSDPQRPQVRGGG
jgi:hypothetical protein